MSLACDHESCELRAYKSGYCNAHYIRSRRGRPMGGPVRRSGNDPERFWEKVERTDGCWAWTAYAGPDGYGRFMFNGVPRLAHRVSYEWAFGSIPVAVEIDHMCHNRVCVNPDHLREATRSLNGQNRAGARIDSGSGIRGVRQREGGRWIAEAQVSKTRHYLGRFDTADEAEAAVVEFRRTHMPYSLMDREAS
jgi:hypothetical protein